MWLKIYFLAPAAISISNYTNLFLYRRFRSPTITSISPRRRLPPPESQICRRILSTSILFVPRRPSAVSPAVDHHPFPLALSLDATAESCGGARRFHDGRAGARAVTPIPPKVTIWYKKSVISDHLLHAFCGFGCNSLCVPLRVWN